MVAAVLHDCDRREQMAAQLGELVGDVVTGPRRIGGAAQFGLGGVDPDEGVAPLLVRGERDGRLRLRLLAGKRVLGRGARNGCWGGWCRCVRGLFASGCLGRFGAVRAVGAAAGT